MFHSLWVSWQSVKALLGWEWRHVHGVRASLIRLALPRSPSRMRPPHALQEVWCSRV